MSSREEFTAWYLAEMTEMFGKGIRAQAELNLAWSRDDGSFADPSLRLALMSWEASRSTLVIEVPELQLCCEDFGAEFIKNIEAVGLKVSA
jgi:hypothetical protein